MSRRTNGPGRALQCVVATSLLVCASTAWGEVPADETERWVPSFSVRSGVTASTYAGSVDSLVVPYFDGTTGFTPLPIATRIQQFEAAEALGLENRLTIYQFTGVDILTQTRLFAPTRPPALPTVQEESLVMNPWLGTSIELMTPGLQSLPTRPRLFVHGGGRYQFGVIRNIARNAAAAETPATGLPPGRQIQRNLNPAVPPDPRDADNFFQPAIAGSGDPHPDLGNDPLEYDTLTTLRLPATASADLAPSSVVVGRGSIVTVEEEPWVWEAGAGVAFTFELFERRLRLKPSVEYQRRRLTVEWRSSQAHASHFQGERNPLTLAPIYNILQLGATQQLDVHGLGPGLELEMDTWQVGPFMLSLFVSSQAYYQLGDTETSARGAGPAEECNDTDGSNLQRLCQQIRDFDVLPGGGLISRQQFPVFQGLSGAGVNDIWGDFEFEMDPWTYQAGAGIRFRLVPERWLPESWSGLSLARAERGSAPTWQAW